MTSKLKLKLNCLLPNFENEIFQEKVLPNFQLFNIEVTKF